MKNTKRPTILTVASIAFAENALGIGISGERHVIRNAYLGLGECGIALRIETTDPSGDAGKTFAILLSDFTVLYTEVCHAFAEFAKQHSRFNDTDAERKQ